MAETAKPDDGPVRRTIAAGKDLVALLRDAALFLLAVLLVAFPAQFNTMLVEAGFEEGSVVGFRWKSKLFESDQALQEAQSTIAELQAKNDELVAALADANARVQDPALLERASRLEDENRTLRSTSEQVQATVSQAIQSNMPLLEKGLPPAERRAAGVRPRSDYSVGVQTLGVDDAERVAINERLRAEGFGLDPVTYSYPAGQRPSWFAPRSTVFHYAAASQAEAQELARIMGAITGQRFEVQRGAGLGVDPARRDVTLFVHYVRP